MIRFALILANTNDKNYSTVVGDYSSSSYCYAQGNEQL